MVVALARSRSGSAGNDGSTGLKPSSAVVIGNGRLFARSPRDALQSANNSVGGAAERKMSKTMDKIKKSLGWLGRVFQRHGDIEKVVSIVSPASRDAEARGPTENEGCSREKGPVSPGQ